MAALWIYTCAVFLSAALLFSVQPMFAKMVLPMMGGTAAVWNTCMFFFQFMLLAAYAYAHVSTKKLGVRQQAVLHMIVVALALIALPIVVPEGWTPPTESTPVFWLLLLLTVAVGAPFFAISATSPLLQTWFAHTSHRSAHDPYFLFAASNLGSMLALLSYPLLIEPNLRLRQQSWIWAGGYVVLAILLLACALVMWRAKSNRPAPAIPQTRSASERPQARAQPAQPLTNRRRAAWIVLSFVPSSWMLGLTSHLTTDVAPIPLVWVIPLTMYLLTFVLVYGRGSLTIHRWLMQLFPMTMLLLAVSMFFLESWALLFLHVLAFFVGSMVCHGKLAQDRPATDHLTAYYFCMSVGGLLGGVFNALIAPVLFQWGVLEYPLTILVGCLLWCRLDGDSSVETGWRWRLSLLAAGGLITIGLFQTFTMRDSPVLLVVLRYTVPVLALFYVLDWPKLFAVALSLVLVVEKIESPIPGVVIHRERSFFAVHRVLDAFGGHWLYHGRTLHGVQFRGDSTSDLCTPLAYFHPTGPLGQIFEKFDVGRTKQRVAIVGLGTGTMNCYARPDQEFTFYEIDPVVKRLAEAPEFFSYLSRCGTRKQKIILGDGRLKLAEAPSQHFDLIILDAFSSDAIPVHLLTREAIAMYLSKLSSGGFLVFQISNKYLDLEPALADIAADAGLVCFTCSDSGAGQTAKTASSWAVLARDRTHLNGLDQLANWRDGSARRTGAPWTDDFSNVVRIMTLRTR